MLQLATCTVRPWRRSDRDALVRNANNRRIWVNLRDRFPHPYTLRDADEWLQVNRDADPPTHFAVEVDGEAAGGIGIELQPDVFSRSAEIGYWLGEPYWGRGIMTEATKAMTAHALQHFDLDRLFAGVFAWNPASARVLEKAGYTHESTMRSAVFKDGQVIDQWMYAYVRGG